jgi:hypothetical protein
MTDRPLAPGGGERLRRVYLVFLLVVLVMLVILLPLVLFGLSGDGHTPILTVGGVVVTVSSVLLLIALVRGRAAVRHDAISTTGTRAAGALARAAGAIAWAGAAATLVTGIVQHYRHVESALLVGIVMAASALIPAMLSDGADRMSGRLSG